MNDGHFSLLEISAEFHRFCVSLRILQIPNARPPGQETSSWAWHTLINTLSCYHASRKSPECQSVKPDWLRYKEHGRQRRKPRQTESGTSGDAEYTHGLVYTLSRAVGSCPVQLKKKNDRNYQNKGSDLSTWRACKTVILFLLGQSMWHLPSFVSVLYRLCKRQAR